MNKEKLKQLLSEEKISKYKLSDVFHGKNYNLNDRVTFPLEFFQVKDFEMLFLMLKDKIKKAFPKATNIWWDSDDKCFGIITNDNSYIRFALTKEGKFYTFDIRTAYPL